MAGWEDGFLADLDPKTWVAPVGAPKKPESVIALSGQGDQPLEVVLASSAGRPAADDVRKMWTARKAHRS